MTLAAKRHPTRKGLIVSAFLCLAGTMLLAFHRRGMFEWLEGRMNGWAVPSPYVSFAGILLWLMCGVLVLVASAEHLSRRGLLAAALRGGMLLLLAVPLFIPPAFGEARFLSGFARWVQAEVDVRTVRAWAATIPLDATPTSVPIEWPTTHETELGVAVSGWQWPETVAWLRPDEVRVVRRYGRTTAIVSWANVRRGAYPRFLVIGDGDSPLLPELDNHIGHWQQVEPGVYAGMRGWP